MILRPFIFCPSTTKQIIEKKVRNHIFLFQKQYNIFFNVFQIKLQYPLEFLVTVSGHYCPVVHGGSPVIRSLTFRSNKRTFGPFGIEVGTPFTFSMDGGLIVGFNGRSGWYLFFFFLRIKWLVARCNWVSFISCPNNKTLPKGSEKS